MEVEVEVRQGRGRSAGQEVLRRREKKGLLVFAGRGCVNRSWPPVSCVPVCVRPRQNNVQTLPRGDAEAKQPRRSSFV